MDNSRELNARTVFRLCFLGVSFWSAPSLLISQEVLTFHQRLNAGQTFEEVNNSLSNAANALLAATTQVNPFATGIISIEKDAKVHSMTDYDKQSWSSSKVRLTASELPLNLLRPVVEPILWNHGVPIDLAAMILVESAGQASAMSPKGARGFWQLMPDTARRYGLCVDELCDDRLDLRKSTDAAASYLHDLYAQFGDWKLALAAYNTGEAHVGAAILRARVRDFDQLANMRMLPPETRNYVPHVLAAAQLFGQMRPHKSTSGSPNASTVFASSSP